MEPAGCLHWVPAGYTGWSTGWRFWTLDDWGVDLKYSASWKRGNHYLKLGFAHTRNLDVKQYWTAPYNAMFSGGGDDFDGYSTGQITQAEDGTTTGSTFGEPWADLMLGLPSRSGGNMAGLGGLFSHFNQSHYSWFVNDDWKLSRNLTLNLGLRWEQPRPAHYEGSPDRSFPTDYNYCGFDFSRSEGRIDPVQMMPQGLDISRWEGPLGLAVPFANLDRRGCYEARWRYFAPRFGLAWRMFGNNRTVLRFGAGLSYDQEFGVLRSRFMLTPRGNVNAIQPRGAEVPTLILGKKLDLPTETELGEYRTCYFSELDWEEGQVYSYNLSIQHEIFPATKLEIGYVGNQGRHIREVSPFNVALPEGYAAPLVGGGTVTLTSDEITAGPRSWIEGDTDSRSWSGQRARRLYPQVVPNVIHRPLGNMNYNSLQAKLERRFQDGLALSLGYTWSKAMALNYRGWGDFGGGSREFDRRNAEGFHATRSLSDLLQLQHLGTSFLQELPGTQPDASRRLGGGGHRHPDQRRTLSGLLRPQSLEPGSSRQTLSGSRRRRLPFGERAEHRPLVQHQRLRRSLLGREHTSGGARPPFSGQLASLPPERRRRPGSGSVTAQALRACRRAGIGLPCRLFQRLQPRRLLQSQREHRLGSGRKGVQLGNRAPDPVWLSVFVLNCLGRSPATKAAAS